MLPGGQPSNSNYRIIQFVVVPLATFEFWIRLYLRPHSVSDRLRAGHAEMVQSPHNQSRPIALGRCCVLHHTFDEGEGVWAF